MNKAASAMWNTPAGASLMEKMLSGQPLETKDRLLLDKLKQAGQPRIRPRRLEPESADLGGSREPRQSCQPNRTTPLQPTCSDIPYPSQDERVEVPDPMAPEYVGTHNPSPRYAEIHPPSCEATTETAPRALGEQPGASTSPP